MSLFKLIDSFKDANQIDARKRLILNQSQNHMVQKTKAALDNCTVSSWATFDMEVVTFRGKTAETFILLLLLLSRPILKNAWCTPRADSYTLNLICTGCSNKFLVKLMIFNIWLPLAIWYFKWYSHVVPIWNLVFITFS